MKLRDVFKKIDVYNELAGMMGREQLHIYFYDKLSVCADGEHVKTYNELRKYIKEEYHKVIADRLLNYDGWELNTENTIDSFGKWLPDYVKTCGIYLKWD